MKIEWGRISDQNFHGKGTGNEIRGPKISWVWINGRRENGLRILFYLSPWSGMWTHLDIYQ